MIGRNRNAVFWGVCAALFFLNPARAQYAQIYRPYFYKQFSQIQHVTTFPDDDTEPAVSPDGRWLAFTSRRSGNRDIWLKSVHGGPAFQLTFHKADDYSPCWAADNRTIYFISKRSDAKGDLWQLRCKPAKMPGSKIQIRQIDNYLGYDGKPDCSPDGKWIAFTSTRLTGERNIWLLDPASNNVIPFTFTGGTSPAWSSGGKWLAYTKIHKIGKYTRQHIFLKIFFTNQSFSEMNMEDTNAILLLPGDVNESFPVWGKNDSTLFFLRYESDTNADDCIDLSDNPALIRLSLILPAADSSGDANGTESVKTRIQVSRLVSLFPAHREVLYPEISQDRLFFALRESGHFNICAVPHTGVIPVFASARKQYEWADSSFSLLLPDQLEHDDSLSALPLNIALGTFHTNRLLAFQTVRQRFPDENPWRVLAGLVVAEEQIQAGEKGKAIRLYQRMLREVGRNEPLFVRIKLALWQARGLPRPRWSRAPDSLRQRFSGNVPVQRGIARFEAELARQNGERERALSLLQGSLDSGPKEGESFIKNLFLQADIFCRLGNSAGALKNYLHILKTAGSDLWRQRACARIISILKKKDAENEMEVLQDAMEKYREFPQLVAGLHIVRGKLFRRNGDS
ncbi:MAG TPA: hypothetical protein ENH29_08470, partial [Bacteroidetes bacterium]|nr:hypothetical protein [Bacteroidota bacterium]